VHFDHGAVSFRRSASRTPMNLGHLRRHLAAATAIAVSQAKRRRTHQKHTPASTSAAARYTANSSAWNVQYRLAGW